MDIRNDQLHMITSEYRQQIREQYAIMGSIKRRVLFLLGDFNFRLNCDRDTAVDLLDKGDFGMPEVTLIVVPFWYVREVSTIRPILSRGVYRQYSNRVQ